VEGNFAQETRHDRGERNPMSWKLMMAWKKISIKKGGERLSVTQNEQGRCWLHGGKQDAIKARGTWVSRGEEENHRNSEGDHPPLE